ncbi:MAG: TauD/TfdA family dioxygenase [Nannocystaceae bacterium]
MSHRLEVSADTQSFAEALRLRGMAYARSVDPGRLVDMLEAVGRPIFIEEVRPDSDARSLVRSRDAIPWHTDHHRADVVLWHCLRQADNGGQTLLLRAQEAFDQLEPRDQQQLHEVRLFEHSVFPGDESSYPMVTQTPAGPRFYYSLWLADEDMPPSQRRAFDAFGAALGRCRHHPVRLEPRDVLAIDNHRILHARTAIDKDASRHLRRYWLAT